ncbi:MAG: methionyl-tRNA formyltransferase [Lachnospiraceae bacterium]|nr:methionyl-tRNA formyltransferase [Lachnospiraceae bacterium]
MKIVFMGTPDFASGMLKALLLAGYPVVGVVTQPDKPKGRKKEPVYSPVKEEAISHCITVYQPKRVKDPEAIEAIRAMEPDIIIVAAFGQIIPKEILDMPRYGCINVHASLLPAYRGASPIQHAILDGLTTTGVTIMRMNEGLDTGDIIKETEVPVDKKETCGSLFDKLAGEGAKLLLATLPEIEAGNVTYTPQPAESTTPYASMIKKSDGKIDWTRPAIEIERQVRGMNPWPSAFTVLDGKLLKIWEAHVEREEYTPGDPAETGRIVRQDGRGLYVTCGRGILVAEEVQMAGKKRMKTGDFLRGYVIRDNDLTRDLPGVRG